MEPTPGLGASEGEFSELRCSAKLALPDVRGVERHYRSDLLWSQARPLEGSGDGCCSKLDGRNILQTAAECSDSRSNWFGNYYRLL
jgi:hypothetical protein